MKIAVVAYICNTHSGARAPIEFACALSKKHSVSFFALENLYDQTAETLLRQNKVSVHILKSPLNLWQTLRTSAPDIISTHTTISMLFMAVMTGIPVINTYYGTQFNVLNERFFQGNFLVSCLDKCINLIIWCKGFLLIWLPKTTVAISQYTQKEAAIFYKRKITYAYLSHLSKSFFFKKSTATPLSILSVSRITPYKGFHHIIRTLKPLLNKNCHLIIVGTVQNFAYFKYLQMQSPFVFFALSATDTQLDELYERSSLYVTADRYLFFGLPILEAAQHKKPTVAFDCAAAAEMVEHAKTGYLAKNSQEFYAYVNRILNNQHLRERLGTNALAMSKKFNWIMTVEKYTKIFNTYAKKN